MITSSELMPGHQIRQVSMAERLGVSRLPVREALQQLTADGLVKHTPNVGYSVTRLSVDEFAQIYLMRKLLETEVIRSLPRVSGDELVHIEDLNQVVIQAGEREDVSAMREANRDFHFAIFKLSELDLVVHEIGRLWTSAAPYHAFALFSGETRQQILKEHDLMVEALHSGDKELLVSLMDQHRRGVETWIAPTLEPISRV